MSTKNQNSSLCKLYSLYEEKPEDFFDETDVVNFFITTFWTFQSPITENFVLARDPAKSLSQTKCFLFAIQTYSNDLFSRKKTAFPKRKLSLQWKVWVNSSKLLITPTKYCRFHYPNLKLRLDLQKQKTNCSVINPMIKFRI